MTTSARKNRQDLLLRDPVSGHRSRIRVKLLEKGAGALSELELLEMLL